MIRWAITLNMLAAAYTGMMVSFGGATSAALNVVALNVISVVILIIALRRSSC